MARAKRTFFCLAEDRLDYEPGLRFAIASLQKAWPGARGLVFRPEPSREFARWLEQYPTLELRGGEWPDGHGWNCKPAALLTALDAGAEEAVWLDSDILVTGNLRGRLEQLDDQVVLVAQELCCASAQGTAWRARAWGFEPAREFGFTINSCVVRVTSEHRELLERWRDLLERPDYRCAQRTAKAERPLHLVGDQDALNALLGSTAGERWQVEVLKSGRDIVHGGPAHCFQSRERWRRLWSRDAVMVHGIDLKPWEVPDGSAQGFGFWFLTVLDLELSAYLGHARTFASLVGRSYFWLERRSWTGRLLVGLGLGHDALRGWPFLIFCQAAKACGFNWLAERIGLVARIR